LVGPRADSVRDLLLFSTYCAYMALGLRAPFVFGLGYVWTDILLPQQVAYSTLRSLPMAMIAGSAAIGTYLMLDRRSPPRPTFAWLLLLLFAAWVTLTATWAVAPEEAWGKWNWAVKTILFAAFLPFLFRSRIQLEALILTFLFALSGHLIATGLNAIVTGGGYGRKMGLVPDLLGIGETSFLSMLGAASIPLILYLKRHSLIIPRGKHTALACNMIALFAVMTSLGTFARTGLVALSVLAGLLWIESQHKVKLGFVLLMSGAVAVLIMSQTWLDRMFTIADPNADSSAGQRLDIWKWTWNYVADHPLGGGFNAYVISSFIRHEADGSEYVVTGRAFHSIYFEILGEHGYLGFGIFALIMATMFITMFRIRRKTRDIAELAWLHDLMKALMMATLIYLAGGNFIGIGFQPPLYYFIAIVISAGQYYARATRRSPIPVRQTPDTPATRPSIRHPLHSNRPDRLAREG
jgi:putative inorganic carbon (hco3(-)) transporter